MIRRCNWSLTDILLCYGAMFLCANFAGAVLDGLAAEESALRAPLVRWGVSFGLPSLLLLFFVYVFIIRLRHNTWAELGLVKPGRRALFVLGVGGGLFLAALMAVLSYLMALFFPRAGVQDIEAALAAARDPAALTALLVSVCFLAPLYEEIFFRGVLYTWARRRLAVLPACLLAGGVFALLHLDLWRFLPIAAGGAILCFLFERSGSLCVSILAHALWNLVMAAAVLAGR